LPQGKGEDQPTTILAGNWVLQPLSEQQNNPSSVVSLSTDIFSAIWTRKYLPRKQLGTDKKATLQGAFKSMSKTPDPREKWA